MSVELGTVTVKVGADIAGLNKGMAAAQATIAKLTGDTETMGAALAKATAAIEKLEKQAAKGEKELSEIGKMMKKSLSAEVLVQATQKVSASLGTLSGAFASVAAEATEAAGAAAHGFAAGGPAGLAVAAFTFILTTVIKAYTDVEKAAKEAAEAAVAGHLAAAEQARALGEEVKKATRTLVAFQAAQRSGRSPEMEEKIAQMQEFKDRIAATTAAKARLDKQVAIQQASVDALKAEQKAGAPLAGNRYSWGGDFAKRQEGIDAAQAPLTALMGQTKTLDDQLASDKAAEAAVEAGLQLDKMRDRAERAAAALAGLHQMSWQLAKSEGERLRDKSIAQFHSRGPKAMSDAEKERIGASRAASESHGRMMNGPGGFNGKARRADELERAATSAAKLAAACADAADAMEAEFSDGLRESVARISEAMRGGAGRAGTLIDGAATEIARAAAGLAASLSGPFQSAIDAFAGGDLVGGILGMAMQSTAVQEASRMGQEFLLKVSEALGDFLAPMLPLVQVILDVVAALLPLVTVFSTVLAPVFRMLTEVATGIGGILVLLVNALMPLFTIVAGILAPLFKSLTDALMPLLGLIFGLVDSALTPLAPILEGLGKVLGFFGKYLGYVVGLVADVVQFIVGAVIGAYNGIIEMLATFVGWFDDDWAASVRSAKVSTDGFAEAQQQATDATYDGVMADYEKAKADRAAGKAAKQLSDSMSNVPSGFKVALARMNAMDVDPKDAGAAATMKGAKKHAKGGVITRPTFAMLGERGAEAVVPLTGSSSGAGLASLGDGGNSKPTMVIEKVIVIANDPRELQRELQKLARRTAMSLSGSPVQGAPAYSGG